MKNLLQSIMCKGEHSRDCFTLINMQQINTPQSWLFFSLRRCCYCEQRYEGVIGTESGHIQLMSAMTPVLFDNVHFLVTFEQPLTVLLILYDLNVHKIKCFILILSILQFVYNIIISIATGIIYDELILSNVHNLSILTLDSALYDMITVCLITISIQCICMHEASLNAMSIKLYSSSVTCMKFIALPCRCTSCSTHTSTFV